MMYFHHFLAYNGGVLAGLYVFKAIVGYVEYRMYTVNWSHKARPLIIEDQITLKHSIINVYRLTLQADEEIIPFAFTAADNQFVQEKRGRLHIILRHAETPMFWAGNNINEAKLNGILRQELTQHGDIADGEVFSYYCDSAEPIEDMFDDTKVDVMDDLMKRCPLLIELHLAGVALDTRLFKLIADVFRDRWLCYIPNEEEAEKHEADLIAYIIYKHGNVFELLLDKGALLSLQPVSVWQSSKPRLQSLWSRFSRLFCAGSSAFAIYRTVYHVLDNRGNDETAWHRHNANENVYLSTNALVMLDACIHFLQNYALGPRGGDTPLDLMFTGYGLHVLYDSYLQQWRPTGEIANMICAALLFGICWNQQSPRRDDIVRFSPVSLNYSTVRRFLESKLSRVFMARYAVLAVHVYCEVNYLFTRQPYRFVSDNTTIFDGQYALLPGDLQRIYSTSRLIPAVNSWHLEPQQPSYREQPHYVPVQNITSNYRPREHDLSGRIPQSFDGEYGGHWEVPESFNGNFMAPNEDHNMSTPYTHSFNSEWTFRAPQIRHVPPAQNSRSSSGGNSSYFWSASGDSSRQSRGENSTQSDSWATFLGSDKLALWAIVSLVETMLSGIVMQSIGRSGRWMLGSSTSPGSAFDPDSGSGPVSEQFTQTDSQQTSFQGTHIHYHAGNGPPSRLSLEEFGRFIQDHASGRGTPQSLLGAPDNIWALSPPLPAGAGQQSMGIATGFPQTAFDISEADYSKNMPAFGADGRQPPPPAQPQPHWNPSMQSLPGDRPTSLPAPSHINIGHILNEKRKLNFEQQQRYLEYIAKGGNHYFWKPTPHNAAGQPVSLPIGWGSQAEAGQITDGGQTNSRSAARSQSNFWFWKTQQHNDAGQLIPQRIDGGGQAGPASAAGGQSQINLFGEQDSGQSLFLNRQGGPAFNEISDSTLQELHDAPADGPSIHELPYSPDLSSYDLEALDIENQLSALMKMRPNAARMQKISLLKDHLESIEEARVKETEVHAAKQTRVVQDLQAEIEELKRRQHEKSVSDQGRKLLPLHNNYQARVANGNVGSRPNYELIRDNAPANSHQASLSWIVNDAAHNVLTGPVGDRFLQEAEVAARHIQDPTASAVAGLLVAGAKTGKKLLKKT